MVPILGTFTRQYWTGALSPSGRQVRSCRVEDTIRLIVQALAVMGAPDPRLTSQWGLDIQIRFQYRCYSKQNRPINRVKLIPLQVFRHISSIATAPGYPLLMAKSDVIIITSFSLLIPGEYTASKSESTPFRLEETAFICAHIIFSATATEVNLQAANFVMLTFMNQNNSVRG